MNLDFSNPLQTRKWLKQLENDPISGIRIKRNLSLKKNVLGFSFDSNPFGLRGPNAATGRAVVIGTSFAMGFAVNIGEDWFSHLLNPRDWFNAGLPVGPREWDALLETYFRGERRLALLLYHPNLWPHARSYQQWRRSGKRAFDFFRWKTDWWPCVKLALDKRRERNELKKQGKRIIFQEFGRSYCLDATYCLAPFEETVEACVDHPERLRISLKRFERVIVFRVPIKEERVPARFRNEHFDNLLASYEKFWGFTQRLLGDMPNVVFFQGSGFKLQHYHGFDTHLTRDGNIQLRQELCAVLTKCGFGETLFEN